MDRTKAFASWWGKEQDVEDWEPEYASVYAPDDDVRCCMEQQDGRAVRQWRRGVMVTRTILCHGADMHYTPKAWNRNSVE